jgi:YesN/AraC family two-component response regulator
MKRTDVHNNIVIIVRPKGDQSSQTLDVRKPIILICDDEPKIIEYVCEALKEAISDCVIVEAGDGEEGVAKCREFQPDIILADFHMPKISGLEMTAAIRMFDQKTHIVLMSGFADKNAVVDFMRLGVNDILDKPIDINKLTQTVKVATRNRISGEARYSVSQFIEVMRPILSREVAERQSPHQLVKRYNAQMPNILATVGILMPSGEIVEVRGEAQV